MERGCVKDQPQRPAYLKAFQVILALRLILRIQPRSENGF
jgi:hypothetical protein